MKALLISLLGLLIPGVSSVIMQIDFGSDKDGETWRVINDGVMGGLSEGRANLTPHSVIFSGEVSLENNGGFSSFRSPYDSYELSNYETVELRLRGKGCAFGFTFSTSRRWFDPSYKHMFTPTEEWQIIRLSLADFDVYQVGRKGNTTLSEKAQAAIIRMGFITDKDPGPFELEIDYIKFE